MIATHAICMECRVVAYAECLKISPRWLRLWSVLVNHLHQKDNAGAPALPAKRTA